MKKAALSLCLLVFLLTHGCSPPAPHVPVAEKLTADSPKATVEGNTFIAPAGWALTVRGPATILEAPEGDSRIALIDVHAKDADAAIEAAWAAYGGQKSWPLKVTSDSPDKDGWSNIRGYDYQTSPKSGVAFGLRRNVQAMFGTW